MKTRYNLINQETGEPDWYLPNQGRIVDTCQLTVLARHDSLTANATITGDHSTITSCDELAARMYIYGIPKDHGASRSDYPLLVNKPLNLPSSVDVGKAIGTVITFAVVPDIIGIEVIVEPRPVQASTATLDSKYGTGARPSWTGVGDVVTGHYYGSDQAMQKNYLSAILSYSLGFRSSKVVDQGLNNDGV